MGSAMFGAVAARKEGRGYDTIEEAVEAIKGPGGEKFIYQINLPRLPMMSCFRCTGNVSFIWETAAC